MTGDNVNRRELGIELRMLAAEIHDQITTKHWTSLERRNKFLLSWSRIVSHVADKLIGVELPPPVPTAQDQELAAVTNHMELLHEHQTMVDAAVKTAQHYVEQPVPEVAENKDIVASLRAQQSILVAITGALHSLSHITAHYVDRIQENLRDWEDNHDDDWEDEDEDEWDDGGKVAEVMAKATARKDNHDDDWEDWK
jgi:hypothetical protein